MPLARSRGLRRAPDVWSAARLRGNVGRARSTIDRRPVPKLVCCQGIPPPSSPGTSSPLTAGNWLSRSERGGNRGLVISGPGAARRLALPCCHQRSARSSRSAELRSKPPPCPKSTKHHRATPVRRPGKPPSIRKTSPGSSGFGTMHPIGSWDPTACPTEHRPQSARSFRTPGSLPYGC